MDPRQLVVIPPIPPAAWLRARTRPLPFPLGDGWPQFAAKGRQSLWQGMRELGVTPGDEVLVPAYNCGAEVEALTRSGLVCRFYEATPDLSPDEDELEALTGPRTRALYLIHYLGFPQDVVRWRQWCDARRLLLIEDAAQSWLATTAAGPVGAFGDISIFGFYKTLGLPDGAAFRIPGYEAPRRRSALMPPLHEVARSHAHWMMGRSSALTRLGSRFQRRPRPYSLERDLDLGPPESTISSASRWLLPRLLRSDVVDRRRANYEYLLERIGAPAPSPFDTLPDGACPFMFPIDVADKAAALAVLASFGVVALNFWLVPHACVPAGRFPAADARREHTLGLPVHSELRAEDLELIVAAVAALTATTGRTTRAAQPAHTLAGERR